MSLSQPSRTIVVEPVRAGTAAPAPVEPVPDEPQQAPEPSSPAPAVAKS